MLERWDRSAAEALADLLSSEDRPFHAGGTPGRDTVLERVALGFVAA